MAEASTSARDEPVMEFETSQLSDMEHDMMRHDIAETRPTKRGREEDEDLWTQVRRYGKRISRRGSYEKTDEVEIKMEAYITSAGTELPKQFAFARFLKDNMITDVLHIKFINPYKILIQLENEVSLEKLMTCQAAIDKGWRIHKALEVESSYGVIRKVEIDLEEEEILKNISCVAELLSVKRLARRSNDGTGWSASECVRLCFKGSSLPPYVYVHGIRVRVEPYTFPVTQCSLCWAFGHPRKMCPRKKVVCPKCSKHHENCEAATFVCVNCTGNHIALSKKCPVYLKERKIRSIMADFNCTYRKALTMYVPEMNPVQPDSESIDFPLLSQAKTQRTKLGPSVEDQDFNLDMLESQATSTYATAVKSTCPNNKERHPKELNQNKNEPGKNKKKKNKQDNKNTHNQTVNDLFTYDWDCCCSDSDCGVGPEKDTNEMNTHERKERRRIIHEEKSSFQKLLETLNQIFFRQQGTFLDKFKTAAKIGIKWLVSFLAKHLSDLPFIKYFLDNYG